MTSALWPASPFDGGEVVGPRAHLRGREELRPRGERQRHAARGKSECGRRAGRRGEKAGALSLAALAREPAAIIALQFKSTVGTTYTLQYSADMTTSSWTDIGSVTGNGASAIFTETDATRLAQPKGYYRVKIPTIPSHPNGVARFRLFEGRRGISRACHALANPLRLGGPKARKQASPGQRPGWHAAYAPSPERAAQSVSPFLGLFVFFRGSQGVALGWLVFAPSVLPPSERPNCMTGSNL